MMTIREAVNLLKSMKDIDIKVDVQTKKKVIKWQ